MPRPATGSNRRYGEVLFLRGLSGTTSLARTPIGPIRSHPRSRAFLHDTMRKSCGSPAPKGYRCRLTTPISGSPSPHSAAGMTSSMHHNLEQGNRLEVPWLSGDVVERGARLGVATPCNRAIADILSVHSEGRPESAAPARPGSGVSGALTIRSIDALLVVVPMRRALGTSVMAITEAPLVLIDLQTEEGITGRAYLFCYLESAGHAAIALTREVSAVLAGTTASPAAVRQALEARFKLLGARGPVSAVMAGVDVACWDVVAPPPGCR